MCRAGRICMLTGKHRPNYRSSMTTYTDLNPQRALIFRIMHRDNMPWVLDHGLHCRNSPIADPNYVEIGNPELIGRRHHRAVDCAPGGTLSDYVPFYFTPFSPMLYNIKTGYGGIRKRENAEIVIVASSLHRLRALQLQFVFTDRHAYLEAAQFSSDLARLDWIDWPSLQARSFKKNDLAKFERYQAEALVHWELPVTAIQGIACYNDSVAAPLRTHLQQRGLQVPVTIRPAWYF